MENEKYINYYIETMTGTMTDAVIRNISLQANARVTNEVIEEQTKTIEQLQQYVQQLNDELDGLKNGKQQNENSTITSLQNTVTDLNRQIAELNTMRGEYDNVKHQVQHVDTFRNELAKERDEHQKTRNNYESKIAELNDRIEYLQLTPAKRKKVDDAKNGTTIDVVSVLQSSNTVIEDGGSF